MQWSDKACKLTAVVAFGLSAAMEDRFATSLGGASWPVVHGRTQTSIVTRTG